MTTTYPPGLPAVPDNGWNTELLADLGVERPDEGWAVAISEFALDAESAVQAELRLLAYLNHGTSPGADLRGTTATAVGESTLGRWRVRLSVPGEY